MAENRVSIDPDELKALIEQIGKHLATIKEETDNFASFLLECTEKVKEGDAALNRVRMAFDTTKANMTQTTAAQEELKLAVDKYVDNLRDIVAQTNARFDRVDEGDF